MNLFNLKCFVDAARAGSMTVAADLNHLSRPAISHAIQKLEDDLGVSLVEHRRRSFVLTQKGILLLKRSEPLFHQVEQLRSELRTSDGQLHGTFRIGSSRTLATFNLSPIIAKMKKQFPNIEFVVQLANSENLIQGLTDRKFDLIFFIGDENISECKQVVVDRGHFCLIKPSQSSSENTQYAITERRPETERLKALYERQFSKPLSVFAEVQSWDAIWNWVSAGICGGLIPDFMLSSKKTNDRKYEVVLPKVFPYEIKIMYSKHKSDNPLIKYFVNH